MSSGIFRISVSTMLAFFRRSSSFSLSSAQPLIASNNALIAHANIFFFMGPPRNGYSLPQPPAATQSMVRSVHRCHRCRSKKASSAPQPSRNNLKHDAVVGTTTGRRHTIEIAFRVEDQASVVGIIPVASGETENVLLRVPSGAPPLAPVNENRIFSVAFALAAMTKPSAAIARTRPAAVTRSLELHSVFIA